MKRLVTYETTIFGIKTIHTDIYEGQISRITEMYDKENIISVVRVVPAIMSK